VKKIKASGKDLKVVYISHSDPDYYFGLNVIKTAFPNTRIFATAPTVAAIKQLMHRKLAYWGPILQQNAPHKLVLPGVLNGNRIMLEGHALEIEGLNGPTPARSYVWIPSLRTVVGGAVVFGGTHVWMADTQTPLARRQWLATLRSIKELKPLRVVPGHYLGPLQPGLAAVKFDENYLKNFEIQNHKTNTAQAVIAAMESIYPNLPERSWLELGAKVIKGDYKWPQ
jgi:glyoxylase-like metal-dependent hydrolase (beta-lactamase superfamily II)